MPEQQLIPVKKGRPTKYSKSIVKDILDKLSRGISIRDAVKECNITWQSWRNWILKDDKLKDGEMLRKHRTEKKKPLRELNGRLGLE